MAVTIIFSKSARYLEVDNRILFLLKTSCSLGWGFTLQTKSSQDLLAKLGSFREEVTKFINNKERLTIWTIYWLLELDEEATLGGIWPKDVLTGLLTGFLVMESS